MTKYTIQSTSQMSNIHNNSLREERAVVVREAACYEIHYSTRSHKKSCKHAECSITASLVLFKFGGL